MRAKEFLRESVLVGTFVHETTPANAQAILAKGFRPSSTGIFFNRDDSGYSGGDYGGTEIVAKLNIRNLLDLSDDNPDDLDEFADGEEIAAYARQHGYDAWADELQIAVLDPRAIQIIGINK